MRARLAAAISIVAIAALGGSFFALHQRAGSDLQARIDSNLKEQFGEFQQESSKGISSARQLERASRSFIASQRYHPESRIFLIQVAGGKDVTNQKRVVEREVARERGQLEKGEGGEGGERSASLIDAPDGLANVSTREAGRLRVYSQPIFIGEKRLGTFRVADPRAPIERAQSVLRNTFLVVGAVALLVSLVVAGWLATLITRPLRRMAGVA